jgi:hypothetical protein
LKIFASIRIDGVQSLIIIEKKLHSPWGCFVGLGMEDSIPHYLKSSNTVQNLFISYSDTVSFVREISFAKMGVINDPAYEKVPSTFKHDNQIEHDKAPFSEFFELFLKVSTRIYISSKCFTIITTD